MSFDIGAADLAHLLGGNGMAERFLRRATVSASKDYTAFVNLLYEDFDSIIFDFQANPQRRSRDSEDRLTEEVVGYLSTSGYTASHGTSSGGHVDLTVSLGRHLTWIGEAKKDQKFNEGFLQLCTRYRPASGNFAHNQAGMLLYCCSPPDMTTRRDGWRKKVTDMNEFADIVAYDCPKNQFAFYTKHTHEVTGQDFIVRHMLVGLIWEPKDTSARSVKARAEKKAAEKHTTIAEAKESMAATARKPATKKSAAAPSAKDPAAKTPRNALKAAIEK